MVCPTGLGGFRFSMVCPTGLEGRGGSQLWSLVVVSSVFLFRGDGGQSASGAVKGGWRRVSFGVVGFFVSGGRSASGAVKGGWRRVSFGVWWWCRRFSGGRGPVSFRGCEGGRGASQLWSLVVVSSVFLFRGDGGQSASGAVKGEGGPVSFGVWWWCRRFFCFGGTGASQLRGCEGGMESALELCSAGNGGQSASGAVLFRGNGGQSASGAVKGEGGPVSFGVWWWCCRFFVSGGRGPVSLRGCEGGMEASQLWSCVLRGMEASQLPGL